jgi:hypothetical protein
VNPRPRKRTRLVVAAPATVTDSAVTFARVDGVFGSRVDRSREEPLAAR